ncbi:MAG: hypothetical protein ACD_2C00169G0002 [uncultured bacterium (gcode 4)]|uniref:DUF8128 domain-containing protein n=1 Tax=uncultured bacterium (gcode 4) TaxID=1234023 RepID=K2H0V8_9BACT|nr:MAG: hypothetical protein ACD_2C00169G0002 [uncultured bacterium (gcode 4)]
MLQYLIPQAHAIIAWTSGKDINKVRTWSWAADDFSLPIWVTDFFSNFWNIVIWIILFWLAWKFVGFMYEILTSKDLIYIKVTLPRADSKLDKEKETKKDFKEKTGIMSIFYKAIHKIGDRWPVETVLNFIFNYAKISLEMVFKDWQVHFYIVTYKEFTTMLTQQITSNYPDAEVKIVNQKEYIDIKPAGYSLKAMSSGKRVSDIFPIKTYKYFEDDPLSSFTNAFWSLKKDDIAVYQIVVKPLWQGWSRKAKKAANLVAKWQYKKGNKAWLWLEIIQSVLGPLYWVMRRFVENEPVGWSNAPGASSWDSYKIFNQAEQESHKAVWESAWQPWFEASIRFLVSSKTAATAKEWLDNLLTTTSIFTDEYNNKLDDPRFMEELLSFILTPLRYIWFKNKLVGLMQSKSVFSVDELSTLYHFPDINYNKSPVIKWLDYKMIAPPSNIKFPKIPTILSDYKRDDAWNVFTKDWSLLKVDENKNLVRDASKNLVLMDWTIVEVWKEWDSKWKPTDEGKTPIQEDKQRQIWWFPIFKDWILMGWNEYRNSKLPIYFMRKDRWRHHYIIWKSWGWKSVLIWYLARQDLWNWDWLCVIDPHGDLVEDVISFTPKERAKDVVIFDPSDYERPMGLNMLEVISTDPNLRAIEKDRAALDATSIFIKIFNEEVFWPRIQHYFRNGCLTLMDDEDEGWTLIDVPRLFVDDAFCKYKVSKVRNPVVKAFWDHEYANTWDREKQEMIPYFSSKFGPFITNTTIRNIIGQPKSAFNLRRVMDDQKVLMVNLSKGLIWDLNAQLLWLIFVSKINMAAMSRADMPEDERKDFYLYVDEFQNFATDTFWEILSEARKYHLALIMAHQFIAQIGWAKWKSDKPSIKDAVFWNAWTIMSFKVGAEDAEYLEKEYAPILSQQDIIWIANFTTYCKLNIDNATTRPFDLKTFWDNTYKNKEVSKIIKEYSRKMYWRKKEYVDMEIEARLWIVRNENWTIN